MSKLLQKGYETPFSSIIGNDYRKSANYLVHPQTIVYFKEKYILFRFVSIGMIYRKNTTKTLEITLRR